MNPKTVEALYDFKASNPHELSIRAGQHVVIAPREVQQTQKLLNTGWALATIDNRLSGLIPINYVQRLSAPQPTEIPIVKCDSMNNTTNASSLINDGEQTLWIPSNEQLPETFEQNQNPKTETSRDVSNTERMQQWVPDETSGFTINV